MPSIGRRQFLASLGAAAVSALLPAGPKRPAPAAPAQSQPVHIYVSRLGAPDVNVQQVIALAGGIAKFVGYGDAVVLKPNGQWPMQGYTHTLCLKALIDVILNRPGGFGGEIIIAEHVHRDPTEAVSGDYCWNMSAGDNRSNNWPDMNYFELVDDYHSRGIPNVTALPLYDAGQSSDWVTATGPGNVAAGKHAWVRTTYTTAATGGTVRLSSAILRSAYSGRLIDLKNGVWDGGHYTGQQVKLMFLPTFNNHGSFGSEDYAGPTSALKCHLGIVEFDGDTGVSLHDIGYADENNPHPQAMGESVGYLITQILHPTFYLTCAEFTGYRGRTDPDAAHTQTVGLCTDPVSLDYWMCKYIMVPCATSQTFMNPDNNNHLRQALLGCHSKGVGTLTEANMIVQQTFVGLNPACYLPLVSR